jgi:hypothetical protein
MTTRHTGQLGIVDHGAMRAALATEARDDER